MLFFKQIMDEKLSKDDFKQLYDRECHICSTTLKVIADLEDRNADLSRILDTLHISREAYEDLKEGENCDPELVRQLCMYLGRQDPDLFKHCRRLKPVPSPGETDH